MTGVNVPAGRIDPNAFELVEEAVPEIVDGEALVRVDWMSLDPANRAWIGAAPSYLPPVGIGEVVRGWGLGTVAHRDSRYPFGQTVQGRRVAGVCGGLEGDPPADGRRRARPSASCSRPLPRAIQHGLRRNEHRPTRRRDVRLSGAVGC
jgi:hypothetical protein